MNVDIEAIDLPEAWWKAISLVMNSGRDYYIDRGSFEGQCRRELDMVTIRVLCPERTPIVPTLLPPGVVPPCSMEYVENYLPYLMTSHKEPNEEYTYGEDLEPQISHVIRILQETPQTNQAYMAIGDRHSINLKSSPCLRGIHCKIIKGALRFVVYFRSWDLWGGFPANLAALQLMKEYMAKEIEVPDGELIALSSGLHLYEHSWHDARVVLRQAGGVYNRCR